jgi:hypothetical protein
MSWSLAGAAVLALTAALVFLGLNTERMAASRIGIYAILAVAVGMYAGTGRLITSRLPGNAIGWLLGLIGLSLAVTMLAEQYALYGLATAPGSMPAAKLAGWFSSALAMLTVVQLFFLVLLFPDGRLPSRRWRPVRWALYAVVAGTVAGQLQAGTTVTGAFTNALGAAGVRYPNPLGIFPQHGWFSGMIGLVFSLTAASVFARRRGGSADLRKQLAWLGYVGLMTAAWAVLLVAVSPIAHGANEWIGNLVWGLMLLTPVAGIPVACVVAVLKYRLYEIDRLISRTVSYAIVTGLLVGVYAGVVLMATHVLPLRGSVTIAVATLAAAAVFSPLRQRVQRVVDRRFNRTRYNAELMTTAFAARLQDATDLDAVRADLTSAVHQALEPAHLSLWLGQTER